MAALYYLEKVNGFLSTSIYLVFLVISLCLPIVMITIGIQELNNCPFDNLIPIWLIIGASILFVHHGLNFILSIVALIQKRRGSWNVKQVLHTYCKFDIYSRLFVHILLVGWLIGGSILVFPPTLTVSYDSVNLSHYCKKICFQLLYVSTIILWCFSGVWLFVSLVLLCVGLCSQRV